MKTYKDLSEGILRQNRNRMPDMVLGAIDRLLLDAKKGKLSNEEVGKIMVSMHSDVVDAVKAVRTYKDKQ